MATHRMPRGHVRALRLSEPTIRIPFDFRRRTTSASRRGLIVSFVAVVTLVVYYVL